MGQLTASIAHETKQPITAARTYAAAALRFLDKSPPDVAEVREALTCIVNETDRASDVVGRIGSLIKKAPPQKEVVDLNAAILEVTALIQKDITERHSQFLDYFYAEEFANSSDIVGSHESRGMLKREKIREYIQRKGLAAKLQEVVIGEFHHRMKNTLAIVSAITFQSLKTANSLEEATKTIAERLHALGVAQDLLVRERWTVAGCRTLIEGAVNAFQSKSLDQFEIAADNIAVSSGPAISLSMVIHELCTNAVKHWALSAPSGRVTISWAVSEDHPPRFKLHWKEHGGPGNTGPTPKWTVGSPLGIYSRLGSVLRAARRQMI